MLRQLKLRDRLVAIAAVQLIVVAVLAAGAILFLDADTGVRPFGLFALGGLIVGAVVAFLVGRSIVESVGELTSAADQLATAQQTLATDGTVPTFQPVVVPDGDPDLGRLANAVNASQLATVQLADSQAGAVKAGLSNIVINLARRSQSLLDRQVEFIDSLETGEEDPDRLHELFKVDHLATRMRRNAESLLVLADAEPPRRRGGPVEIADVLRVAMGEVENYESVSLISVDEGRVSSGTAVDLAHMVAELMENATQFSPPQSPVQIDGRFSGERFHIAVVDTGIGMSDDQLALANQTLANPPELDLNMGRSLGFVVVGRLARRLRATVSLRKNDSAGLTAVVDIPTDHFLDVDGSSGEPVDEPTTIDDELSTEGRVKHSIRGDRDQLTADDNSAALSKLLAVDASTPAMESEGWTPPSVVEEAPLGATRSRRAADQEPPKQDEPAKLEEAVPTGDAFDTGVASLLSAEPPTEWQPPAPVEPGTGGDALVQRTRNSAPAPINEARTVAASNRKPDEVRSMLSKYREGLKDGRKGGTHPDAEQANRKDEAQS